MEINGHGTCSVPPLVQIDGPIVVPGTNLFSFYRRFVVGEHPALKIGVVNGAREFRRLYETAIPSFTATHYRVPLDTLSEAEIYGAFPSLMGLSIAQVAQYLQTVGPAPERRHLLFAVKNHKNAAKRRPEWLVNANMTPMRHSWNLTFYRYGGNTRWSPDYTIIVPST